MSEAERHANNLELFLDLVFVFAVTQIATLIDGDLTISGVARGALVALLVWWQWSQFTWAGSAVNLQQRVATRVLVLCTIPATLTMAVAIPHSFGIGEGPDTGAWFGIAYLVVQLLVLGMQGTTAMRGASTRKAFVDFASFASIAPVLVAVGGFTHDGVRVAFWVAAAAVNLVAGLRGASGEWVINPVHFAERHTLFVIISLGEAVVAIGATATRAGLDRTTFVGLVAGSATACVLWWVYFAFTPAVLEHTLRNAGTHRGTTARDLFTFGHFPIVMGILGYAVAVKHMVDDPRAPLPLADRWLLIAAMAVFIGGCLNIQWHVVHRLAPERFVAIAVITAWLLIGASLAGWAAVGGIALVLAAMQAITWRRFSTGPLAEVAEVR